MSAVLILVNILLALVAIVLIVAVLAQEGTRQGLGAITGGAETFFGKNKAKSMEGTLELVTKICATAFIVLAIVSTVITSSLNKVQTAAIDNAAVDTVVEETVAGDAEGETTEVEGETAEAEGESAEG